LQIEKGNANRICAQLLRNFPTELEIKKKKTAKRTTAKTDTKLHNRKKKKKKKYRQTKKAITLKVWKKNQRI
jgi:hypothetical protein